jgi:hypothetical protein
VNSINNFIINIFFFQFITAAITQGSISFFTISLLLILSLLAFLFASIDQVSSKPSASMPSLPAPPHSFSSLIPFFNLCIVYILI